MNEVVADDKCEPLLGLKACESFKLIKCLDVSNITSSEIGTILWIDIMKFSRKLNISKNVFNAFK